ncbi:MAG: hypothetical protein HOP29_03295 [Phycisphaerales bacterium]|nr:hypothetical protein [Phycisphaerales bacterium]
MLKHFTTALMMIVLGPCFAGCGVQRVFYRPSTSAQIISMYDVVLAADFGPTQPPPDGTTAPQSPPDQPPPDDESEAKRDTIAAETRPDGEKVVPYTAPGSRVQQLTLIALTVSAFGTSDVGGAGREVAESSMMGFEPAAGGRPGLTAPTTTRSAIAGGRPGLQQGFASGLGFASPDRNIFTPIQNPLSGPTGRCGELATAGFFADRAACEIQFRR